MFPQDEKVCGVASSNIGISKAARATCLPAMLFVLGLSSPAAAQFRDPLAGLMQVKSADVVEAAAACAQAATGGPIQPAALLSLGWKQLDAAEANNPEQRAGGEYVFEKPGTNVQISVSKTGDAARTCSMWAIIGSGANAGLIEAGLTKRFGPGTADAPNIFSMPGLTKFSGERSVVLYQVLRLGRGGPYRAMILVHPLAMTSATRR
jgi:hypothetical protein